MPDRHLYALRKTHHYEYRLECDMKESRNGYTTAHIYVGNPKNPCLSLSVPLEDSLKNNRYDENEFSIAHLNKIKDMKECILSGAGPSFAKEMLHDVFDALRHEYKHIHHIRLDDTSFIPCGEEDTLDLLRYSIGLYGKTWYEMNFNAYFVPREKFIDYKCKVYEYSKKETKPSWSAFLTAVFSKLNPYAKDFFDANQDTLRELFETSETYPVFFQQLSRQLPKEEKCRFFKGWFEQFVESFVIVPRTWYIDLYTVSIKGKRGGTRKIKRG